MKMHGPGEYRIPNTMPMIHEPAIPRALTDVEYTAVLIDMLVNAHAVSHAEAATALQYTIFELEEMVIAAGMNLPIVRRSDATPAE